MVINTLEKVELAQGEKETPLTKKIVLKEVLCKMSIQWAVGERQSNWKATARRVGDKTGSYNCSYPEKIGKDEDYGLWQL